MELIGEYLHNNDAHSSATTSNTKNESKKSESELAESDEEFNLDEEIAREQDEKRTEYYRSNPLRSYASNKGEQMVPQLSNLLKKKQLPHIYKDLRKENSEQSATTEIDRNSYKYKLKGDLKVNLTCIDTIARKDKMEIRETKKVYTEFSRNKVTKPIELKNVQSTIKSTLLSAHSRSPVKSFSASNHNTYFSNNSRNNPFASASETNLNTGFETIVKSSEKVKKEPFIEAKSVKINTLDELTDEIKNRSKYKLEFHSPNRVIYDNYDNENVKYTYRERNHLHEHYQQATFDELELSNHHQLPKGTLLSFKQASASPGTAKQRSENNKSASIVSVHEKSFTNNLANGSNYPLETKRPSTDKPRDTFASEFFLRHDKKTEECGYTKNADIDIETSTCSKKNFCAFDNRLVSANTKHRKRVEQAREKVLNGSSEKANLNKLTLIQPFEDTKILINLHKVPSKVLNNLFNNKERAKSYLIPPVKAFGYLSHKSEASSTHVSASNTVANTSAKTMRTATTVTKATRRANREPKFNSDSQDSFLIARYLPLSRDFSSNNNQTAESDNNSSKPKLLSTR